MQYIQDLFLYVISLDACDPASLLSAAAAARCLRRSRSVIVTDALAVTEGGVVVLFSVTTGGDVSVMSDSELGMAWVETTGMPTATLERDEVLLSLSMFDAAG